MNERIGHSMTLVFILAFFSQLMCKTFTDTKSDDADLESLTNSEKFNFKKQFSDPRINNEIKFTLKWLDREGALDF